MTTITGHTTRASGTILTATIYNADHVVHVTNAQNLNNDKAEGPAGPVVDGHAVLFNGTAGNLFQTAGFVPANVANVLLIANDLSDVADAATAFGNIKQAATASATGAVELGTVAEVRSSAAGDQVVTTSHLDDAADPVALTDAATVAVDWSSGINFTLTVTANRTLGNPTNEIPGQWRMVEVVGNDGTARTLSFGSEYEVSPTLTDITSTKSYVLAIYCCGAGRFRAYADDGGDPT